jgi:hypothetical protein
MYGMVMVMVLVHHVHGALLVLAAIHRHLRCIPHHEFACTQKQRQIKKAS